MSEEWRQLGFDTKAVKLGYEPDVSNNYSIVPPIGLSTTFQQDDSSSDMVSALTNLTNDGGKNSVFRIVLKSLLFGSKRYQLYEIIIYGMYLQHFYLQGNSTALLVTQ
jgi:hypothetical protein